MKAIMEGPSLATVQPIDTDLTISTATKMCTVLRIRTRAITVSVFDAEEADKGKGQKILLEIFSW